MVKGLVSARGKVLELAILGQLSAEPIHGYELRKRLNAQLGAFRTLSYGSLYPALRRMTAGGLISQVPGEELPHALSGRRGRIVYQLTEAGLAELTATLATAEASAWDDDAFDVRFSLFATTDVATRLRILEGRRARMVERLDMLRTGVQRTWERMDHYTAELSRHGMARLEREVEWLERLIDTERGTPGPHDFGTPAPPRPSNRPDPSDRSAEGPDVPERAQPSDRPDPSPGASAPPTDSKEQE